MFSSCTLPLNELTYTQILGKEVGTNSYSGRTTTVIMPLLKQVCVRAWENIPEGERIRVPMAGSTEAARGSYLVNLIPSLPLSSVTGDKSKHSKESDKAKRTHKEDGHCLRASLSAQVRAGGAGRPSAFSTLSLLCSHEGPQGRRESATEVKWGKLGG